MTAHANPHPLQNSKVDQKNPMKIVFHLISYNPKSFPKNLFSTRLKPTEIYKSHTVFIPKCIATTLIQGWWMNCPLKFVLKSVIITAFSHCQNFVLNFFHFLFPHFLLQSVSSIILKIDVLHHKIKNSPSVHFQKSQNMQQSNKIMAASHLK